MIKYLTQCSRCGCDVYYLTEECALSHSANKDQCITCDNEYGFKPFIEDVIPMPTITKETVSIVMNIKMNRKTKKLLATHKKERARSSAKEILKLSVLARRKYEKRVRELTEETINNNKSAFPLLHLRKWGKYVIDHIVPISFGFDRYIPENAMADMCNLNFTTQEENTLKGIRLTDESRRVLKTFVKEGHIDWATGNLFV